MTYVLKIHAKKVSDVEIFCARFLINMYVLNYQVVILSELHGDVFFFSILSSESGIKTVQVYF